MVSVKRMVCIALDQCVVGAQSVVGAKPMVGDTDRPTDTFTAPHIFAILSIQRNEESEGSSLSI